MASGAWHDYRENQQSNDSPVRSSGNGRDGRGDRRGGGGGRGRNRRAPSPEQLGPVEHGVIDTLKDSFGFISCLTRDNMSMFFHYSTLTCHPDDLRIGGEVEFNVAMDRKSGRPVARNVSQLEPGSIQLERVGEDMITGKIVREAKISRNFGNRSRRDDTSIGKIEYESEKGVTRISYAVADQEDPTVEIHDQDIVTFQICDNRLTQQQRAVSIVLMERAPVVIRHGIICSLKDGFGFIDQLEVDEQIFFHFSEYPDLPKIGNEVAFESGVRNDKALALNLQPLTPGTVQLEQVLEDVHVGEISKALPKQRDRRDQGNMSGMLDYADAESGSDIQAEFTQRDISDKFPHALRRGDRVKFQFAIDNRNGRKRPMNITKYLEDVQEGEQRETGVVTNVKDGFGFLKCADRSGQMFFHFSELFDPSHTVQLGDEMEFSVVEESGKAKKFLASRIKVLPAGTVKFEVVNDRRQIGVVTKAAIQANSFSGSWGFERKSRRNDLSDRGEIEYTTESGDIKTVQYRDSDVTNVRSQVDVGDKVEFSLVLSKQNGTQRAEKVVFLEAAAAGSRETGYISDLKESFGFIENSACDREYFFHYSEFNGDASELQLCERVSFEVRKQKDKNRDNAIRVHLAASEQTTVQVLEEQRYTGIIQRGLVTEGFPYGGRVVCTGLASSAPSSENVKVVTADPNDDDDAQQATDVSTNETSDRILAFGITSLSDPGGDLAVKDEVEFSIAINADNGEERAVKISKTKAAPAQVLSAKVETMKSSFGFIGYKFEDKDHLFFHVSSVDDGEKLNEGDEVEFILVHNPRTQKYHAAHVKLVKRAAPVAPEPRPEHLKRKPSSISSTGPSFGLTRQPSGPDGTKGFSIPRRSSSDLCADAQEFSNNTNLDPLPSINEDVFDDEGEA